MLLRKNIVIALKRKCGELGISAAALGRQLNLTRQTLDSIFKRDHRNVTPATYKKLSDWLIDQYLATDIQESKEVVMEMTKNDEN